MVVNNVEVKLDHKELVDIIGCLSDNLKNEKLFDELAKSPSSTIRMNVSWKEAISDQTVELLLADSNTDVLDGIVDNGRSQWTITEEIIERLISNGDADLLCTIADKVDDFYECDINMICERLVDQKDPQVRKRLASNSVTPVEFIEQLCNDSDVDVARAARNIMNEFHNGAKDDEDWA